jgi:hypothetical protein
LKPAGIEVILTGGKWLPECVSILCHLECDSCLVRPECV